ncbi:macrolide ABC transporter ATP-binding protein [Chromatiales bacterium (ex Bugula neritina AB1)]|nr:macrolide ABC transporter ATP-binding protein [Chromatiales bacterium (ex Bugula neritina AB1)]
MISLSGICKTYVMGANHVRALDGIDLTVEKGEFLAVQGSSGSGKSTLLNILGILDSFDSGTYTLDNTSMSNLSQLQAAHYRNRLIGFVFQSFNLIHHKTAVENVALPLYYQGIARRKRNTIAMEYLERVGLAERAQHKPAELSGGQSQRVAIARALITRPSLLLADEPTGALDTETSEQIMAMFKAVNDEGMTVVVVTHEAEVAAQTHRIINVRDGRILSDERTDQ